jgi:hypothetical protein
MITQQPSRGRILRSCRRDATADQPPGEPANVSKLRIVIRAGRAEPRRAGDQHCANVLPRCLAGLHAVSLGAAAPPRRRAAVRGPR